MSTLIFLVAVLLLSVAARGSVVAAGIGSGDAAENPPVPMPTFHGVNIHFSDPMPGEVQQLKQGFQGCRMDFHWGSIETTRGVYNFSAYDTLLASLQSSSPYLTAYWILDYGNNLYDNGLSPATQASIDAFVNFVLAGMAHFEGNRIIWEMWNEPNGGFWKPKPNATAYAALANAVGAAVKAKYPGEMLVGPTTAGMDYAFMTTVFKAGVLRWFDAVSVHPYRQSNPETVLPDYSTMRGLIKQFAPTSARQTMPILSGEWGYTTCTSPCTPPGPQVTDEQQAQYLVRQWLVNTMAGVPVSIWYDWRDDGTVPDMREDNFGTVNADYQNASQPFAPKPAFTAAVAFHQAVGGLQFGSRLAPTGVPADSSYVLSFLSSSAAQAPQAYAAWSTVTGSATASWQASGCFDVHGIDGAPSKQVCASQGVLSFAITQSPCFLVRAASWELL